MGSDHGSDMTECSLLRDAMQQSSSIDDIDAAPHSGVTRVTPIEGPNFKVGLEISS